MSTTVTVTYSVFKTISDKDMKKALYPFVSIVVLLLAEIQMFFFISYRDYLVLYIIVNGLFFGLLTSKLIISTMSGRKMKNPTTEVLVHFVLTQIAFFSKSIMMEKVVLVSMTCYITVAYYYYFKKIILQLMRELKIEIF